MKSRTMKKDKRAKELEKALSRTNLPVPPH